MDRPNNKEDLIVLAEDNYVRIISLIDTLTIDEKNGTFPNENKNRNIRDVIGHLVEWQKLFIEWYNDNVAGKDKEFLPLDYRSDSKSQIDMKIWEKHQKNSLDKEMKDFENYHNQIIDIIKSQSNEDLFVKGRYSWLNNESLSQYVISATSGHYMWALTEIKDYVKTIRR